MLQARKTGFWRNRYEVTLDGRTVATWESSAWRQGAKFTLDGRSYQVRGNAWGTKYSMEDQSGREIALAERVGRKRWTIQADGRTHDFQRASMWRHEEELVVQGRRAGYVKRTSAWRSDTVADLPTLPLITQVFVLGVIVTHWDNASAAASSAAVVG